MTVAQTAPVRAKTLVILFREQTSSRYRKVPDCEGDVLGPGLEATPLGSGLEGPAECGLGANVRWRLSASLHLGDEVLDGALVQLGEGLRLSDGRHVVQRELEAELLKLTGLARKLFKGYSLLNSKYSIANKQTILVSRLQIFSFPT